MFAFYIKVSKSILSCKIFYTLLCDIFLLFILFDFKFIFSIYDDILSIYFMLKGCLPGHISLVIVVIDLVFLFYYSIFFSA